VLSKDTFGEMSETACKVFEGNVCLQQSTLQKASPVY